MWGEKTKRISNHHLRLTHNMNSSRLVVVLLCLTTLGNICFIFQSLFKRSDDEIFGQVAELQTKLAHAKAETLRLSTVLHSKISDGESTLSALEAESGGLSLAGGDECHIDNELFEDQLNKRYSKNKELRIYFFLSKTVEWKPDYQNTIKTLAQGLSDLPAGKDKIQLYSNKYTKNVPKIFKVEDYSCTELTMVPGFDVVVLSSQYIVELEKARNKVPIFESCAALNRNDNNRGRRKPIVVVLDLHDEDPTLVSRWAPRVDIYYLSNMNAGAQYPSNVKPIVLGPTTDVMKSFNKTKPYSDRKL